MFVYIFVYICVCNIFCCYVKYGIIARIGAPGNGNAVEQTLACTCRAGVNLDNAIVNVYMPEVNGSQ